MWIYSPVANVKFPNLTLFPFRHHTGPGRKGATEVCNVAFAVLFIFFFNNENNPINLNTFFYSP